MNIFIDAASKDAGKPIELEHRYIELLMHSILCTNVPDPALKFGSEDPLHRLEGRDWPSLALSMVGLKRAQNLVHLCTDVIKNGVDGHFLEAGVWRGGMCILMRGIIEAYQGHDRLVICADSFEGLPPPDAENYPADTGDILHTFDELAVSLERVQANFSRYNLLDEQTIFVKGWFEDTMPTLRDETFSILRLDGDMYQSTMDVLENLYDRLTPGGYLITDDYAIPTCEKAISDFRNAHGITDHMHEIDWTGIYWQKT